jgi:hypothetical protein
MLTGCCKKPFNLTEVSSSFPLSEKLIDLLQSSYTYLNTTFKFIAEVVI